MAATASFVQANGNTLNYEQSSITVNLSGITAGNLIVLHCAWSGDQAATASDGISSLAPLARVWDGGSNFGQVFYLLAANGGNKTFTVTFAGQITYPEVFVYEFAASQTVTWNYDTGHGAGAYSTAASSGNITTQSTNPAIVITSTGKLYNVAATTSNPLIGGGTPVESSPSPVGTYDHQYYLLNTPITNGAATLTYDGSTYWTRYVAAFYGVTTGDETFYARSTIANAIDWTGTEMLLGPLQMIAWSCAGAGGAHQYTQDVSGAITPVGSLTRKTSRAYSGGLTPSGAAQKAAAKSYSGSITPSGALTIVKAFLVSLAGSIGLSGAIVRGSGKALSGSLAPSGAITKAIARAFAGGITPSGILSNSKAKLIALAGSIGIAGRHYAAVAKNLAGSIAISGVISKQVSRIWAGIIGIAGTVANIIHNLISKKLDVICTDYRLTRVSVANSVLARVSLRTTRSGLDDVHLSDSAV
jgi:hypothetical protein